MKDLKNRFLKIICTLLLICVVIVLASFVFHWIGKAIFNLELNILELIVVFAVLGFPLIIGFTFVFSTFLEEVIEVKWSNWISPRLQRYELGTRYVLRSFMIKLGVIVVVGAMLIMILMQLTNGGLSAYTLVPLFSGLLLGFFGSSLISYAEISLLHFRKFRNNERKYFKDLKLGLKNYNMAVNFTLQRRKLYAITQYAKHIFSLGLKKEIHVLNMNIDKIIEALENKHFDIIPKTLNKLAKNTDSFVEKYGNIGISIEPPRWTRTKEAVTSSFHKVLPQLIWLLIVIAIFLVLRMFIPIEISIP